MSRIAVVALIIAAAATVVYAVVTLYDNSLQVGRMWETPGIKPHENPIPVMAQGSVPFTGGGALYQAGGPALLRPPFDLADPAVVTAGRQAYTNYCVQCHGRQYDGNGTVGQSFAPLPRDLRSETIQNLPIERMFLEISYGLPGGRQPPLAATMTPEERWQVIGFIKSLDMRSP